MIDQLEHTGRDAAGGTTEDRRTRAWRRTGIVIAIALVLAGLSSAAGATYSRTWTQTQRFTAGLDRLSVDGHSGDITVRTDPVASEVVVVARARSGWQRPEQSAALAGRSLELRGGCRVSFFGPCSVSFEIVLPPGQTVELALTAGSGNIRVDGTAGRVTARTGSGNIMLTSLDATALSAMAGSGGVTIGNTEADAVEATASSGDVTLTDVGAATVTAKTSSGDVSLDITTVPDEVIAQTSSGNATVRLPRAGSPYAVEADTGSGNEEVSVDQSTASPRTVNVRTGSGDARVGYRD